MHEFTTPKYEHSLYFLIFAIVFPNIHIFIFLQTILTPQIPFYTTLGQECVTAGCGVDLFLFPNAYTDIATIGEVCKLTGGDIYKYEYFMVSNSLHAYS